jgi:hypothetical protein
MGREGLKQAIVELEQILQNFGAVDPLNEAGPIV